MPNEAKKSIKLDAGLYRRLIKQAKDMKRTFTGHLEDIVEKHLGAKA
jgi:macrodomain Ter protein organizer (MatP/YcbG family)